jgi:predicted RND superfamily exporter protein
VDLPRSVTISVALVLVWLGVVFRRPGDVALALLPLAFALICTVGFLAATGQRFNPINAVALPLLDGIAVDAGVFLVAASRAGPRGRAALADRFRTTGPAVLAAALTTVAGFGALAFTRTPAVRSLGVAASVGILAAFAGAILLLMPLLLRRAHRAESRA